MPATPRHADMLIKSRGKRGRPGHRLPVTELGKRLRQLRVDAGLRQDELSAKLGTGQNRVCDWENGFHLPQLPALKTYADFFGTTVAKILEGVM